MTPHRLRRAALQRTRKRSQRDPQDFYHGLLALHKDPARDIRLESELGFADLQYIGGRAL